MEVRGLLESADIACEHMSGAAATKEAVTSALPRASITHLATHGCPDGLFLAGDADPERPSLSTVDVYLD